MFVSARFFLSILPDAVEPVQNIAVQPRRPFFLAPSPH
jgi:hypothetical protein